MDNFFSDLLIKLLLVSMVYSVILMALIQKIKNIIICEKKSWQVWVLNLICSFVIGIPFGTTFYNLTIKDGIWVGLFSFIGASSIYQTLKKQNLINYTPTSLSDKVILDKDKEIVRDIK